MQYITLKCASLNLEVFYALNSTQDLMADKLALKGDCHKRFQFCLLLSQPLGQEV